MKHKPKFTVIVAKLPRLQLCITLMGRYLVQAHRYCGQGQLREVKPNIGFSKAYKIAALLLLGVEFSAPASVTMRVLLCVAAAYYNVPHGLGRSCKATGPVLVRPIYSQSDDKLLDAKLAPFTLPNCCCHLTHS